MRAASYDARDLKDILRGLEQQGKEVGVHGLDAWRDATAGAEEKQIISEITGTGSSGTGVSPVRSKKESIKSATPDAAESGVRMHWLYFGDQSYAELEKAGFHLRFQSEYNGTVGYRAGTAQVFRPLRRDLARVAHARHGHCAAFPSHLNLSPGRRRRKVAPLIENADLLWRRAHGELARPQRGAGSGCGTIFTPG